MMRTQLKNKILFYAKFHISARRLFASSPFPEGPDVVRLLPRLRRVRILGPTLWCLTAASAVYLGCAAYEVRQDVAILKRRLPAGTSISYDDIGARKVTSWIRSMHSERGSRLPDILSQDLSSSGQLITGTVAANLGIFAACRAVPLLGYHFAHLPSGSANYTLFTSMFGHAGLMHLGFNMYAFYGFTRPLARSKTFEGSGSHLAAFYLSTGMLASLAQHLASIWPNPVLRVVPSLGASGGVMAVVGAFGMTYPEAPIGIVFIPVSFPAQSVLAAVALVEMYGLFIGKWMRLGHAAHLAGLAAGSAYVHFKGNERLWEPARRFMFHQMRRLKMV
ncbi:hypothetical protein DL764_002063 [Monosporascus ibericus]|uniref:Peptidase S54 rhomboid domain-containing protein n=1 Tax=Monosporascus ibericus TaxID=155417 RepID=A0A4Q4TLY9_9PEZI|nr:hypothetical protein DL764_002063 [Monosporascus ibericus]